MITRHEAIALDNDDPLAGFRDRFVIADSDLIYLDGNSLGRLPKYAQVAAPIPSRLPPNGARFR